MILKKGKGIFEQVIFTIHLPEGKVWIQFEISNPEI